jgi:hypothetical protein
MSQPTHVITSQRQKLADINPRRSSTEGNLQIVYMIMQMCRTPPHGGLAWKQPGEGLLPPRRTRLTNGSRPRARLLNPHLDFNQAAASCILLIHCNLHCVTRRQSLSVPVAAVPARAVTPVSTCRAVPVSNHFVSEPEKKTSSSAANLISETGNSTLL